jgi:pimeloyl-ACP methyl ester carboxylesterase
MTHTKKLRGLFTLISFCIFFSAFGQKSIIQNIDGTWVGKSSPDSCALSFKINFEKKNNHYKATFISDEQRALDIPLQKVTYDSTRQLVTFALIGDVDSWNFEGNIKGNVFTGTITKGNQKADFTLIKQKNKPLPYNKQEVTFINDTVKLSGSLYLPKSFKKVPAIIFIHGSGPEPRFASAYFADYFSRRGIAVLIYDKRGVGKSTGNWKTSTFVDLAKDAVAGIKLLEKNLKIDKEKIGVYGHSQGGSICPMLLTMYPELSFGISSGSAGVSMQESDWYEVQNRFKRYVSGSDYDNAMRVMNRYLNFASTGEGYEELVTEAKKYEKEQWFQDYIGNIDSTAFFFHYYRNIGNYNAIDYWKKVKQPVLILKGEKDQVSPGYPSFQNIENALKQVPNKNYKIVVFPNTSHEMHIVGKPNDFWFKATPNYSETIYKWLKTTIIDK